MTEGCTMAKAQELRELAGLPEDVRLEAIAAVVDRAGDQDLGMTALTMIPRPPWVADLLGLHPDREVGA